MTSDQQMDVVMPFTSPGGTLLSGRVDASQDPVAKLPPPAQQAMDAGSIAFRLGLSAAASDYQDGTVTCAWASGRREDQGECTALAGTASREVQERCTRLQELDKACLDSMVQMINAETPVSTPDDWKSMLLLDNEKEIMSLPCVGFHGMPSAAQEAYTGKSMVMLSKLETDGASPTYRLHFCIARTRASMRAEEIWGKQRSGCLGCQRTPLNASADHHCVHTQDMKFVTLAVEGNLFHIHGGCEDSAMLVSRFGGSGSKPVRCSCSCCIPSTCLCPSLCSLPCSTGYRRDHDGYWRASTSFEDSLGAYIERIAEESSKESAYKFPKMDPVSNREECAMLTRQLHCVQLIYRDTATNCTQSCIAVIKPDEPISNVAKFVSTLSLQLTADPAKAKSDPWLFANPLKSLFRDEKR